MVAAVVMYVRQPVHTAPDPEMCLPRASGVKRGDAQIHSYNALLAVQGFRGAQSLHFVMNLAKNADPHYGSCVLRHSDQSQLRGKGKCRTWGILLRELADKISAKKAPQTT